MYARIPHIHICTVPQQSLFAPVNIHMVLKNTKFKQMRSSNVISARWSFAYFKDAWKTEWHYIECSRYLHRLLIINNDIKLRKKYRNNRNAQIGSFSKSKTITWKYVTSKLTRIVLPVIIPLRYANKLAIITFRPHHAFMVEFVHRR